MEEKTAVSTAPVTTSGAGTEVQTTPQQSQWPNCYPMYNYDMTGANYYPFYLMNPYPPYQTAIYHQVQQQMLENKSDGSNKFVPPLPPGPSLPNSLNSPHISKPPLLNTPKQFSPIRFNLNGKRLPNGNLQQNNSLTSGAAKKKRKRNRNNQLNNLQNQNQNNNFSMPPLPPPEQNIPKPAPPPETMPPSPPLPPLPDTSKPPPPQTPEKPQTTPVVSNNPTDEWPPSLKDYVNRCYAKCKTNIDKNQVEIILKGKITHAYQIGQLHSKDWSNEPLPNIHSERPTLVPKTVPGQLAQFQNTPKKGLSPAMGARLGARASTLRGNSRSSSRSRSRSPAPRKKSRSRSRSPRRHRSSSSSSTVSSDENFKPLVKSNKNKIKSKLASRLGPTKNKFTNKQLKKQKLKEKKAQLMSTFGAEVEENSELLMQRAARFNNVKQKETNGLSVNNKNIFVSDKYEDSITDFDWTGFHIVGTCQDLEKSFLRLTKAPEACEVRPVEVLKLSLQNVKTRWKQKPDYYYTCDQLKSIRQDLTVQGVRNEFTVEVYETHARIALEKGDHEEFNQCQTQLKMLYSEVGGGNKNEFTAYRILYYIFTKNTLDIMTIMKSLSVEEKRDPCIEFSLRLRSAWSLGNFHRFFQLYLHAPLMAGFLVDWFIERERKQYLKCIIKSYRQNISVNFIQQELAFPALEETLKFLEPFTLTFTDISKTHIDCKSSMTSLPN
ncbi:leukocyte receptor cluster member 8 -like, partial [Asbolus verrucosus]